MVKITVEPEDAQNVKALVSRSIGVTSSYVISAAVGLFQYVRYFGRAARSAEDGGSTEDGGYRGRTARKSVDPPQEERKALRLRLSGERWARWEGARLR